MMWGGSIKPAQASIRKWHNSSAPKEASVELMVVERIAVFMQLHPFAVVKKAR